MLKQVAENLVNLTILLNHNLVTRIYFALNNLDVTGDFLIVDFMMLMLGFVFQIITKNGNMIGLNMKMVQNLVVNKDNVPVSICINSVCVSDQATSKIALWTMYFILKPRTVFRLFNN